VGLRIAREVVVALEAIDATQHRHAHEAADREPELPALNAMDAPLIGEP